MALYPRIPLISLFKYSLDVPENDFMDAFYYPDDETRDMFLTYFLLEYGQFTPIYQEPQFLIAHIAAVSESLKYTIDKLYATLDLEYDPIENYDRHENWTDTRTPDLSRTAHDEGYTEYQGGETTTFAGGDTLTYNGGESTTKSGGHTEARNPHDIERQVSADNTGAYYPSEKTIEDEDSTTTTYNSEADTQLYNNRSDVRTYNDRSDTKAYNDRADVHGSDRSETETGTDETEHAGRIHGNIGVTTSQQMIKSEREDVAYYNFIDDVARLYGEKLCILIY